MCKAVNSPCRARKWVNCVKFSGESAVLLYAMDQLEKSKQANKQTKKTTIKTLRLNHRDCCLWWFRSFQLPAETSRRSWKRNFGRAALLHQQCSNSLSRWTPVIRAERFNSYRRRVTERKAWSTARRPSLWHFEKFKEHYVVFPHSRSGKMSMQKRQSRWCHISEFLPSIFYDGSSCSQGQQECWSLSQPSLSADSRTGSQFMAWARIKKTNNPTHSYGQSTICVHGVWTAGGSRSTRREAAQAQGEHGNATQNWCRYIAVW